MPCYSVQTCNVNLNNADHHLLKKALENLGYTVQVDRTGKIVAFSKGAIQGRYDGKQLTLTGPRGSKLDGPTNEIMAEYSRQVVLKQVERARKNNWDVTKQGNEWVFKIPPGRSRKVFA